MMKGPMLYQVSLLQALSLGRYDGSVAIGELKRNGDSGLGTFDGLDGERIIAKRDRVGGVEPP